VDLSPQGPHPIPDSTGHGRTGAASTAHGAPHERELLCFARRQGIAHLQLLAMVVEGDRVLLVDHPASGTWALPFAWWRPADSLATAVGWLCGAHLGLREWHSAVAAALTTVGYDGDEVLQVILTVQGAIHGAPRRPGRCMWWSTRAAPPPLHPGTDAVFARMPLPLTVEESGPAG
jgi:hypothetical protein